MSRVVLTIDLAVYPLEIVLRTCHAFSARCCVFASVAEDGKVFVELEACGEMHDLAGAFSDVLHDIHARAAIAGETTAIRESFAAEAFCEEDRFEDEDVHHGPIRIVR